MRTPDVLIRPMTAADVPALQVISDTTFHALDQRTFQRGWPDPQPRTPAAIASWELRTRHFLSTDPSGSWVAEVDGRPVGFATSYRRELMWILASFNVSDDVQGAGIGAQLLAAALRYGEGCLRGMFAASDDPKALRRYRLAGFTLHPQFFLHGVVDRTALPVVRHLREGSPGDRDLLESLDRRTRGAGRGSDHDVLASLYRLVVVDRPAGQGYAYIAEGGAVVLLAATNRRTAAALVWEALASAPAGEPVELAHVTAANQWALDVGLAARLDIWTRGHLALRNLKPPAPYLHHGTFL